MKRIASLLMAILIVAACAVNVSAATPTATLTTDTPTVVRGDEVTLYVNVAGITEETDGTTIEFTVPEGLTYKDYEWLYENKKLALNDFNGTLLKGVTAFKQKSDVNGQAFKLVLTVDEDAPFGDLEISFHYHYGTGEAVNMRDQIVETPCIINVWNDCPHAGLDEVEFINTDSAKHWKVCPDCEAKLLTDVHNFDHDCDAKCDTCGYVRTIEHTFSDKYSSNLEAHYYSCENPKCDEVDGYAEHVYDQEVTEDYYTYWSTTCTHGTLYYLSCVCGEPSYDPDLVFEVGEADPDLHYYRYDYEAGKAICQNDGCGDEADINVGESVDEIPGLKAPEGTEGLLKENMELLFHDMSSEIKGEDCGSIAKKFKGYKALFGGIFYITVDNAATADIKAGMTITIDIPEGTFEGYKNIKALMTGGGDAPTNFAEITFNEDYTQATFTVPAEGNNTDFTDYVLLVVGRSVADKTSDSTNMTLWVVLLAVAMLGATTTVVASKKRATK